MSVRSHSFEQNSEEGVCGKLEGENACLGIALYMFTTYDIRTCSIRGKPEVGHITWLKLRLPVTGSFFGGPSYAATRAEGPVPGKPSLHLKPDLPRHKLPVHLPVILLFQTPLDERVNVLVDFGSELPNTGNSPVDGEEYHDIINSQMHTL